MDDDTITLKEFFEARFDAMEKALELLATGNEREVMLLRSNVDTIAQLHNEAHAREHALTQEALDKASTSMERRLEGMNEFRSQLREQAATFVRRDLLDERMTTLGTRMEIDSKDIKERVTKLETASANMSGRLWALGVVFGILVVFLQLAIKFLTQ